MTSAYLNELFSLQGKIALISGASSGLGAYFAEVLAKAGARVVVAARRVENLDVVVDKVNALGGEAYAFTVDVTDSASVEKLFAQLQERHLLPDILINNAGISTKPTRFTEMEESQWKGLMEVNLFGAWRIARAASIHMKQQASGVIVNTGSIYSLCTGLMKADYNVSKVALEQLSKNMALELGRYGIRVNTLCPGYFASAINENEFNTERGQAYIRRLVPQRLGNYRELDGPLLLLTSQAGSFMNGSSLLVDGGSILNPV